MKHSTRVMVLFVVFGVSSLSLCGIGYGLYKGCSFLVRTVSASQSVSCKKLPMKSEGANEYQVEVVHGTLALTTHLIHGKKTFEKIADIGSGQICEIHLLSNGIVLDFGCRRRGEKMPSAIVSTHGVDDLSDSWRNDLLKMRQATDVCYAQP
jgi:hypothetical protein